jgi:HAD superfamily hydrolase (TIGR01490 family)
MKDKQIAAAFYDLEGTLTGTNLVHTLAFYAQRQQGFLPTFKKSALTLAEDRLRFFADELFEKTLKPAIFPGAFDLIRQSKKNGHRQVVLTGALDFSVEKLLDYLGIDDYVANRLEFVNGYATGRVLPPVMASATKAAWIREYAEKNNVSLSDSYAYTDSISDLPMLSIVGHPAAINPDFRLKQVALQHNWAILDLKWICHFFN